MTLVTQRAAVLNKDVLTQAEVLVALRTIAPQDREAIDAWLRVHGTPAQREQLMASLPSLPVGTAWLWSPGWLDTFQQVQIRRKATFDSSATPKVGAVRLEPKTLAPVDLERLRTPLTSVIERTTEEDPRERRRRIAELERAQTPQIVVEWVDVPVLQPGQIETLQALVTHHLGNDVPPKPQTTAEILAMWQRALRRGEWCMLEAVVKAYPKALSREELGEHTGYTASGGTFGTYLGVLRRNGLIEVDRELVRACATLFLEP